MLSDSAPRKAAVVGSPVEHSLSPVLHGAAYAALGLGSWSYERIEGDAERVTELVDELGPEWVGLSVTMPGKRAALEVASAASERAEVVGAANTLVRRDGGWFADCTDVEGVTGALRAAGGFTSGNRALLLGAGGTALAALAGFADLGVREVTLAVREPARAAGALAAGERLGLLVRTERLDSVDFLEEEAATADVVVSTLPAGAADRFAPLLAKSACALDVIYHPWPTPLARAVEQGGGRLATGLDMLLHQAFAQVELFTGRSAPREAMRDALAAATGGELPLPL